MIMSISQKKAGCSDSSLKYQNSRMKRSLQVWGEIGQHNEYVSKRKEKRRRRGQERGGKDQIDILTWCLKELEE